MELEDICRSNLSRKKILARKAVPWWNECLSHLRKSLNKIRKDCKRYKKLGYNDAYDHNHCIYTTMRKQYRCKIEKSKKDSWNDFIHKNISRNPWGLAYKLMTNKITNSEVFCAVKSENLTSIDWRSSAELILNSLLPNSEGREASSRNNQISMGSSTLSFI
ncbi:unnamed protein product [Lasius platythorax]|uniref:Uncharacterized protein n=1 Tax=Lasius platythorax TaxID=488582 RepID=A0AAV2MZN2_9HYME